MIFHCEAHTLQLTKIRNNCKEIFIVEAENALDAKDAIKEHYNRLNDKNATNCTYKLLYVDVAISLKVEY